MGKRAVAQDAFEVGCVQAAPGVVVSAPDPAAVRSYRALEPETRIVCIGAAPGVSLKENRVARNECSDEAVVSAGNRASTSSRAKPR